VNQINLLDPLPFEEEIEDKLEKAEVIVDNSEAQKEGNIKTDTNDNEESPETDDSGQAKLF
jgi:hypothetical protein